MPAAQTQVDACCQMQGLKIEPFKHPIAMDPNYAGQHRLRQQLPADMHSSM